MAVRLTEARRVVVVDLGFGDAGKGTVTDYLARRLEAAAVVRFNGGAQAGHTVVLPDGRAHTFAQLGAGSFVPGVRTFLAHHVVFHPTALLVEAEHLARAGVSDAMSRLHVSERCLVTTPVHQAATCIRELARGGARHGSCGVGVGETVRDSLASPGDALRAGDLGDEESVARWVRRQQERTRALLDAELRVLPDGDLARRERAVLESPAIAARWASEAAKVASAGVIGHDDALGELLRSDAPVVFEGAQGVLLDEWLGFHPFTTWSTCTWDNAEELMAEHRAALPAFRLGVVRAYATRHGAGPFPTESRDVPTCPTREHNVEGPWQGAFRRGFFDAVLARYALAAAGGADGVAVTHLDQVPVGSPWKVAVAHDVGARAGASLFGLDDEGFVRSLTPGPLHDLGHVEALGRALVEASPVYEEVSAQSPSAAPDVASAIERRLDVPVVLTSAGPTADDKQLRG